MLSILIIFARINKSALCFVNFGLLFLTWCVCICGSLALVFLKAPESC